MAKHLHVFALCSVGLVLLAAILGASPAQGATVRHQTLQVTAAANHTWYLAVGAESADHAIQGMHFLPGEIWINVGDTVVWTARSSDIHTVTFLMPGQSRPMFNPSDAMQGRPYGGTDYDGRSYHNSGILSTMSGMYHSYALHFSATGTFYYICLVHQLMYGVVHVLPSGWQTPYTQADYNQQIQRSQRAIMRVGANLIDVAEQNVNQYEVWAGVGSTGGVSIMRFINSTIYVHPGDIVTFVNYDPQQPHTVTFGPVSRNASMAYGDPMNYDGSQALNSGYLGRGYQYGSVFQVRFTRAGVYHFECSLHYTMGMTGTVIVG